MKIAISVQISVDGPPDDFVVKNLKEVGFEEQPGDDGGVRLSFDGDISENDLAYGASMMRSLKRN